MCSVVNAGGARVSCIIAKNLWIPGSAEPGASGWKIVTFDLGVSSDRGGKYTDIQKNCGHLSANRTPATYRASEMSQSRTPNTDKLSNKKSTVFHIKYK
jgi:hypothetical protein